MNFGGWAATERAVPGSHWLLQPDNKCEENAKQRRVWLPNYP